MGIFRRRGSIPEEQIHDILRNGRRRATLAHLRRQRGAVSVRELSVVVAERESGESPPPTDVRESVYNSLRQTHLPKLDREGVVRYDDDRKTVELEAHAREVGAYMEAHSPSAVSWAALYRSVAILALGSLLAIDLQIPVFAAVDERLAILVSLTVVLVTASYQFWHRRWAVRGPFAE